MNSDFRSPENNIYIATFFAHFGAVRFERMLRKKGIAGRIMPVPRNLSSSCGSCVRYEGEEWVPEDSYGEIEQIVKETVQGYECIYRAKDS